jgi:hypothetical protein
MQRITEEKKDTFAGSKQILLQASRYKQQIDIFAGNK